MSCCFASPDLSKGEEDIFYNLLFLTISMTFFLTPSLTLPLTPSLTIS